MLSALLTGVFLAEDPPTPRHLRRFLPQPTLRREVKKLWRLTDEEIERVRWWCYGIAISGTVVPWLLVRLLRSGSGPPALPPSAPRNEG